MGPPISLVFFKILFSFEYKNSKRYTFWIIKHQEHQIIAFLNTYVGLMLD